MTADDAQLSLMAEAEQVWLVGRAELAECKGAEPVDMRKGRKKERKKCC